MTARKATDDTPDEATAGDATNSAPAAGVDGATGTPIDGTLNVADAVEVGFIDDTAHALATLGKALGNAHPDVTVTAVLNGHGTWAWTARATADGRKLAAGGPHRPERLTENLQLLFGGQTVALHATGLDKPRRLS